MNLRLTKTKQQRTKVILFRMKANESTTKVKLDRDNIKVTRFITT